MRHPFQCLALVPDPEAKAEETQLLEKSHGRFLLAGCGPQLFNFDIETGEVLARWPLNESKNGEDNSDSSTEIITGPNDSNGHPRKKRRKTSKKDKAGVDGYTGGAITRLIVSKTGRIAVAATDEDKLVHVFDIDENGQLMHLNQRRMAKRPCAIALTPEEDFILVGDKFGDVYALPLQYEEALLPVEAEHVNGRATKPAPFKPSATNLTVHTQRNLQALKNQMLQQQPSGAKRKEGMNFAHDLLLGHVSMLTDLVSVSVQSPKVSGLKREYIITCDRDEHIRISRGRKQAHIIENYCFGHAHFVSRLCLLDSEAPVLVSGGGDDHLYVWNWRQGRLLGRLHIQHLVQKHLSNRPNQQLNVSQPEAKEDQVSSDSVTVAVLGLWQGKSTTESQLQVWCACEGVAAILGFSFELNEEGLVAEEKVSSSIYELPGNALAVASAGDRTIVAVDTVHAPGNVTFVRQSSDSESSVSRLVQLTISGDGEGTSKPLSLGAEEGPLVVETQIKRLGSLLYGIENLRKHSNEELD